MEDRGLGRWYAMLAAFVVIALVGFRHSSDSTRREPSAMSERLAQPSYTHIEFGDFTYAPTRTHIQVEQVEREQRPIVLQQRTDVNVDTNVNTRVNVANPYYDPYWLFSEGGDGK